MPHAPASPPPRPDAAPAPADAREGARLHALYRYDVLDTRAEATFDRITRLARSVMGTPIALISLVDESRQWFKSRQGLDACQTALEMSFCARTIESDRPLQVADAREDPFFRDSPLVTGGPKIRFYLGVPLVTPEGHRIGTLCAIDRVPRTVRADQVAALRDLARLTIEALELRLLARLDGMTGVLNRPAFHAAVTGTAELAAGPVGLIVLEIDHFRRTADTWGPGIAPVILQHVASLCRATLRAEDFLGRIAGRDFAIGLPGTDAAGAAALAERLRARVAGMPLRIGDDDLPVTLSLGVHAGDATVSTSDRLNAADRALHRARREGRNRVVVTAPEAETADAAD